MSRHTWRWFDYSAVCEDCDWNSCGKNALGIAAQHHDRTGHTINVEVSGNVTYCGDDENRRRETAKTVEHEKAEK